MKNKKKVIIAVTAITGLVMIGAGLYVFHQKVICAGVPEFVRMHGLRKTIRYIKGYDVYEEIYNEIGV